MSAQSGLVAVGDGKSTLLPSTEDTALALRARRSLLELSKGIGSKLAAPLYGQFLIDDKTIKVEIPIVAIQVLIEVMQQIAQGKSISIIPANAELTTQQAADFLNVSRPYFVKLIEEGHLPFRKVGTRRRVQFKDLVEFKRQDLVRQTKSANELATISQEIVKDLGEDY